MLKRVLIGVVIALVTVGALALGLFVDRIWLSVFFGIVIAVCVIEVRNALNNRIPKRFNPLIWGYAIFLSIPNIIYIGLGDKADFNYITMTFLWIAMILLGGIVIAVIKNEKSEGIFYYAFVLLYPTIPLLSFLYLNVMGMNQAINTNIAAITCVLTISSLTDVFAYFGGTLFGKHKMCPQISPKKTWEGAVSGLLGGSLGAVALYFLFEKVGLFGLSLNVNNPLVTYIIIGILGSVATQFGDLTASLIKRITKIKDYSHLLGSHGGFTDRFDGAMMTATLTALILAII
ncbi:MAG: CDP-archaeol synthase [Clostridia bacterium]